MIKRAFTEHPASVGESYFQHMGMAFSFSAKMIGAGLACFVHGFFPFLFKCTGRNCIEDLHNRMVLHRDRRECAEDSRSMPALDQAEAKLRAAE